jgi:hypothetical protein
MVRIRIKSGDYAGRYVDSTIGGLPKKLEVRANPPVKVPGTQYSLHAQEGAGTRYFEDAAHAVQAELKKLGFDTELVET